MTKFVVKFTCRGVEYDGICETEQKVDLTDTRYLSDIAGEVIRHVKPESTCIPHDIKIYQEILTVDDGKRICRLVLVKGFDTLSDA